MCFRRAKLHRRQTSGWEPCTLKTYLVGL
uniref:Uncharacterized protein n=1 Tax=Zea mays TaxID=4577 RepID=B4FVW7_MAIZE|nr:unknown [Zea mays]